MEKVKLSKFGMTMHSKYRCRLGVIIGKVEYGKDINGNDLTLLLIKWEGVKKQRLMQMHEAQIEKIDLIWGA